TMLDDHAWFAPFIETWTAEKLPWAATPAVHSYEALPEEYERLVTEYAGAQK
ncbi:MAG: aldehyde-activating protein, partial [Mesorhizobium sp.]